MEIRYVLLNPTGNLTGLVLDPVPEAERSKVTAALMDRCEQVGYLVPPENPLALARLRMMGGEFCGNATMGTAAFLAERAGCAVGEERVLPLEASGAEGVLDCRVRREAEGWLGTVEMPGILQTEEIQVGPLSLTAVFLPGMVHLIHTGRLSRDAAETLIRQMAEKLPDPAVGLLQWEEKEGRMTPLVYVRDSGTLVWETACGSGSTAIAAWKAGKRQLPWTMDIHQPGGTLSVEVRRSQRGEARFFLTGRVRIGRIGRLTMPE